MFVLSSEMRDQGEDLVWEGRSAVLSLRECPAEAPDQLLHPSPFPCPLQPAERSCRGLPVPRLGFLISNDAIRAVCIPPASLSAPGSCAVCHLEQRPEPFGLCYSRGNAAFQGARNGAGCHPVGTAPRQPRGANPKGAAQQFKCHNSGAAFFTTAGLT